MPPRAKPSPRPAKPAGSQLTDAGPIAAIFDQNDQNWHETNSFWEKLPRNTIILTTYPCLVEVTQLAQRQHHGKQRSIYLQSQILHLYRRGKIQLHHPGLEELRYITDLMEKYQDNPMSMADASLVAAAEALQIDNVFTFNMKDFRRYVLRNGTTLMLYPEDFALQQSSP